MKRLSLLLAVLLCACSPLLNSESTNGLKAEKNSSCADFNRIKVFQTLDNFALANVCDSSYSDLCIGMVVRIDKDWNMELWDDKVITPPEGKCFIYDGTYQYETKAESKKTVPVLRFGYKYTPASMDEALNRASVEIDSFHKSCLYSVEVEDVKHKSDKRNFCDCAKQAMTDGIAETLKSSDVSTKDDLETVYAENIISKMKQCTTKYPKALED